MRYNVKEGAIRSENAAKPVATASRHLVQWIRDHPSVARAADVGCGKLRYSGELYKKCRHLTLVDSEIQLDRLQVLFGKTKTVREHAQRRWKRASVLSIAEFHKARSRCDLILCANVLSAIPSAHVRSRLLRAIGKNLCAEGTCLFVTQYTNSYFTELAANPKARKHLDGWILDGERGLSYFGVLNKDKVTKLVQRHGLIVARSWTSGQSAYVLTQTATAE